MNSELAHRIFVLDTNVLMHDPTCLFRFHEHDVFIPMVVLEELDSAKKGMSEVARNVRQVGRFLDTLINADPHKGVNHGIDLSASTQLLNQGDASGRLFIQTQSFPDLLPDSLPGNKPDNAILSTALGLSAEHGNRPVTLVSKDINLRIKASAVGLHAEDYESDKVLDDADLLYSGVAQLSDDFWEEHSEGMESWQEAGRTWYQLPAVEGEEWFPNQLIYVDESQGFEGIVRETSDNKSKIELPIEYRNGNNVWGVHARNREQNFALNLLMDPDIDFVSLVGIAGTGKTLLALAAGLAQTLEENRYREIIMTRVTIPVAEDIGFLPGTEEEKMTPWMGALMDNLEVLAQPESGGEWGRAATNDLLRNRIRIRSVNFMRGRTFLNRYIIVDEAQNLTPKQIKTLVTRAGPGTKFVCLGNIGQIDTPYLTETNSGLTYVVDRFMKWSHSGHATLQRGERSRLADYASSAL